MNFENWNNKVTFFFQLAHNFFSHFCVPFFFFLSLSLRLCSNFFLYICPTPPSNIKWSVPKSDVFSCRCVSCGCPGCLSVYHSITTNIYATEERIMAKVEQKLQHFQRHIDLQFDALYQSLQLRQEQLIAHAVHGNPQPGLVHNRRISAPSKVGDTSV